MLLNVKKYLITVLICLVSATAHSATTELSELLDILLKNGTITEAQRVKLLKSAERKEKNKLGNKKHLQITSKGGITIDSYDGSSSFEFGGRLMIDSAYYEEDINKLGDGTELRRARLEAEGVFYEGWGYELGLDFSDGADIKDAYIQMRNLWPATLKIGHFKEPFSLEELTSSKYITFMERALLNEFAPGRNIGIAYSTFSKNSTAAIGVFGEDFDDDVAAEGDEGVAVTARMTYSPLHKDMYAFHLGTAMSYREPNDEATIKFNTRPESHVTDTKFVNTGTIDKIKNIQKYAIEAAWVSGPVSLQSEYMRVDVDRTLANEDFSFSGWYLYASWFLTGESRNYKFKKGGFGKVKSNKKNGAWELATRYSLIDLNDGSITGGLEENITLGLNWYINKQLRIMANYILINDDINADDDGVVTGNDDPNLFQLRMQANF